MSTPIKKAVFPVAGLGTRFLPVTKANPKEMLPICNKPLIQYAVEEAVAAGVTQLIFVTSNSKRAIEDHFDSNHELELMLESRGKYDLLSEVRDILPADTSCVYIRQQRPLGLGHAILCAKQVVGNEPFAVLLADDLIDSHGSPCLQQMVEKHQRTQSSVIAVENVADEDVSKYGIIAVDEKDAINAIVEKPTLPQAPSRLGVVGRYVLSPRIFSLLEKILPGKGSEIQLTDAIAQLLLEEAVYAHRFDGVRYDCGSQLGYLKATMTMALRDPQHASAVRAFMQQSLDQAVERSE